MFRVIILIVALITGGVAAWLAVGMRPQATTIVKPAPPIPMQDVLVASIDLGAGETLTRGNVRWQPWPESMLSAGYITRSAQPDAQKVLEGAVLRSRVTSGEPMLKGKLVPPNSGFLSAMLPSGKRAVAVRISAESTAGGFILPNDRVDVLHTIEQEGDRRNGQLTRTILNNVIVLAIDQTIDESSTEASNSENGKNGRTRARAAAIGKTATLEVDPAQAEIIAAAEVKGRISLALRSSADNAEPVAIRPQPASLTVRIIRGGRAETLNVQ